MSVRSCATHCTVIYPISVNSPSRLRLAESLALLCSGKLEFGVILDCACIGKTIIS